MDRQYCIWNAILRFVVINLMIVLCATKIICDALSCIDLLYTFETPTISTVSVMFINALLST